MTSLKHLIKAIKVSSVLNGDIKNYGKQFLIDGSEETCWNSEAGETQFILLFFSEPAHIRTLELMFQGGFVAKDIRVIGHFSNGSDILGDFEPADINHVQVFTLQETKEPLIKLEIRMVESTDFYGRVTVYKLDMK